MFFNKSKEAETRAQIVRQVVLSHEHLSKTTRTVERENSFPWELLGLLGLAGLIPQKRQVEVHQARDTDTHRPATGTRTNS